MTAADEETSSQSAVRYVLTSWIGVMLLIAALVMLIPLRLEGLGFGVGAIATVSGAAGVGGILSADLIGRAAQHTRPIHLVRGGIGLMGVCVVAIGLLDNLALLAAFSAITGFCTSAVRVGAQMIVRNRVDDARRGRVHGTQGFVSRVMVLIAPVGIGLLWEQLAPLWSFVAPAAVAAALLVVAGALPGMRPPPVEQQAGDAGMPLTRMLRYGSGPILFTAARSGRMLLLPLVGLAADMSPTRIGLLVGLTAAADVLVSPASGQIMDRRGRLATIVPAFSLMTVGFIILGIASTGWLLVLAAIVLGVGNGLSSGLLLTLGTDLAPAGSEGPFLGRFGAIADLGRLVGPFLVGLLGEQLGLSAAAFSLGAVTALGLACVLVFVGETRPPIHA